MDRWIIIVDYTGDARKKATAGRTVVVQLNEPSVHTAWRFINAKGETNQLRGKRKGGNQRGKETKQKESSLPTVALHSKYDEKQETIRKILHYLWTMRYLCYELKKLLY